MVRTVTSATLAPIIYYVAGFMDPHSPSETSPAEPPTDVSDVSADQPAASLKGRWALFTILAMIGGVADLWTKQAIFAWRGLPGMKPTWWVIEGYVGVETAVNIGAVFGLGAGQGQVFAVLSIGAAIGIVLWLFWFRAAQSLWLTTALGLITGGIIGNLYDRLGMWWQPGYPNEWKSGVRDWILWQAGDQWKWPNFNIADSLLVVGACMLLYQSFFLAPPDEHQQPSVSKS